MTHSGGGTVVQSGRPAALVSEGRSAHRLACKERWCGVCTGGCDVGKVQPVPQTLRCSHPPTKTDFAIARSGPVVSDAAGHHHHTCGVWPSSVGGRNGWPRSVRVCSLCNAAGGPASTSGLESVPASVPGTQAASGSEQGISMLTRCPSPACVLNLPACVLNCKGIGHVGQGMGPPACSRACPRHVGAETLDRC